MESISTHISLFPFSRRNVRKERIEILETFLFLKRSNTIREVRCITYISRQSLKNSGHEKTNNTVIYIITLGEIFVTSKYLKKKNTYTKKISRKKRKCRSIISSLRRRFTIWTRKMQKRAAYSRENERGGGVPGWNNKKVANRVEKRARSRWYRSGRRLCKRYAISDKWRGRERNRDEERARPLASHRRVYLLLS